MSEKKMSLFAQRMSKQRENRAKEKVILKKTELGESCGERSCIVTGDDAVALHEENLQKLSSMTPEEIELEREKLIEVLSPDIVQFLTSRRKIVQPVTVQPTGTTSVKNGDRTKIKATVDVPEYKELMNRYPHMDVVESEKLQWVGELKKPDPPPPDKQYNARFDFEGNLLPYSDEGEGVLKGLHNHGEEQERPGYTLQELIQLSRSSVLQQRIIALNTLSKVLANARIYEECFDKPLIPALLEADTFLLLRFSLDDKLVPVVMASTQAMCNLIVNHTDETCLDLMLGMPFGVQQPSLGVVLEMKSNDIVELKDQELLKLDLIRGALRTDLLPRIRYIMFELNPEPLDIKPMLKMLTRIARHSYEIANCVFTYPNLLKGVKKLLETPGSSYFPEALKLLRILIARSRTIAINIEENLGVLKHIFSFISGEKGQGHPEAMHLILESFYTWKTLLSYNIGVDTIGHLTPVLMRLLEAHFGLTNLNSSSSDLEHATAIMSTLHSVPYSVVLKFHTLIMNCTLKWSSQLLLTQTISLSAAKLIGASFHLAASAHCYYNTENDLVHFIEKLLRSEVFHRISEKLRRFSWLLCGKLGASPENLPCLGSAPPTLNSECTLPLLHGLAAYIISTENKTLAKLFVGNGNICDYIEHILESPNVYALCGHWYARQELSFLVSVVHIYTLCVDAAEFQNDILFHNLAFLLLTMIQSGDKYLLPHVFSKAIFNTKLFRSRLDNITGRMQTLNLETNMEVSNQPPNLPNFFLDDALSCLDEIETMYRDELGMTGLLRPSPPPTLTGLLNSTQPALPKDWPYIPILRLYETSGVGENSEEIAYSSLQWTLLLEEACRDRQFKLIGTSSASKYCRLSCLFLAGNDLFREITLMLEANLKSLLKNSQDLNFEESVPGLTSFYDFYRQLLEQFAGVSYCDTTFGQFILVPLQQKHNAKYKKLVWSEQSGVVRLLRIPIADVCIKDYLEPCETDGDLLMTYLFFLAKKLVCESWSPILYTVAIHHVATYIKNNSDKISNTLTGMIEKLGNVELKNLLQNYERPINL